VKVKRVPQQKGNKVTQKGKKTMNNKVGIQKQSRQNKKK